VQKKLVMHGKTPAVQELGYVMEMGTAQCKFVACFIYQIWSI